MTRRTLICFCLLWLGACGDLPQPFAGAERNDAILDTILVNPGVMITPVVGIPAPLNAQIAEDIAQVAQALDIAAVTRGAGRGTSLLRGEASIVPTSGRGKDIVIDWILNDTDGLVVDEKQMRIAAFDETADDPWLVFANTDLSPIVEATAAFLYERLERPSALIALPEPPPPPPDLDIDGIYLIHVETVTGAPGDGSRSLTEAMKKLLSHEDLLIPVRLMPASAGNKYTINGRVSVKALSDSVEEISIEWDLISPEGEVLGTAGQRNQIVRGSLDGKWGDTALFAVEAAAEGILGLLLQFPPMPVPTGADASTDSAKD